jgi:hypothetical protein
MVILALVMQHEIHYYKKKRLQSGQKICCHKVIRMENIIKKI